MQQGNWRYSMEFNGNGGGGGGGGFRGYTVCHCPCCPHDGFRISDYDELFQSNNNIDLLEASLADLNLYSPTSSSASSSHDTGLSSDDYSDLGLGSLRPPPVHRCNCNCCPHQLRHGVRRSRTLDVALSETGGFSHVLAGMRGSLVHRSRRPAEYHFLQGVVARGFREELNFIVDEVANNPWALMSDSKGKYLFQSLVERCSAGQRAVLVHAVVSNPSNLRDVCCTNHGTRSMQKLVERCGRLWHLRTAIVRALLPNTLVLATHANGKHVLELCLKNFTRAELENILSVIANNVVELSKCPVGCTVVQCCLELDNNPESQATWTQAEMQLVMTVMENALYLSEDPYGNYVIQLLVCRKGPGAVVGVHRQLKGHYVNLCMEKYSSHVVEKCIELTESKERAEIIRELIQNPAVLRDRYGNYVIQKALCKAEGDSLRALVNLILANETGLSSSPYGKLVVQKVRSRGF